MAADTTVILTHLERTLGPAAGRVPEVQFHCPFCIERRGSESDKRTLRVNVAKGKAICFRCQAQYGSLATLLKGLSEGKLTPEDLDLIESRGPTEYVEHIRGTVLLTLYDRPDLDAVMKLKPVPLPECVPVWEDKIGLHRRGQAYMRKRGVEPIEGKRFNIHYCAADDDYGSRLIFPVHQGGRVVYWTNRSVRDNDKLKSKNPTNREGYFTKNDCLLNFDNVVGAPVVNLCEGPFDMFAFNHPVALMGKEVSDGQITLLRALEQQGMEELVLSLDSEVDPLPYYERLSGVLGCDITYLPIRDGDPFELRHEIDQYMAARHTPTVIDAVSRRVSKVRKLKTRDHDEDLMDAVDRLLRKKPRHAGKSS